MSINEKTGILRSDRIHTLSVYVSNKPGVLARIAHVFARRGFNIDSLVVSASMQGKYSRMTIAAAGSREILNQVILQLNKLVDVIHCIEHTGEDAVVREMALVKIHVENGADRTSVLQIAEHFRAKTIDLSLNSMILMVTGTSSKIDASLELLQKFNVVEVVRTGNVVMARGSEET